MRPCPRRNWNTWPQPRGQDCQNGNQDVFRLEAPAGGPHRRASSRLTRANANGGSDSAHSRTSTPDRAQCHTSAASRDGPQCQVRAVLWDRRGDSGTRGDTRRRNLRPKRPARAILAKEFALAEARGFALRAKRDLVPGFDGKVTAANGIFGSQDFMSQSSSRF